MAEQLARGHAAVVSQGAPIDFQAPAFQFSGQLNRMPDPSGGGAALRRCASGADAFPFPSFAGTSQCSGKFVFPCARRWQGSVTEPRNHVLPDTAGDRAGVCSAHCPSAAAALAVWTE
ncbi:hypothetical protein AAFF_G00377830 [Aldrovandia affinis]|uniref:Uncharacterized protein n=1 Tax=Aldrovandia affinis TaxID=143900 RepID=A0AAD7SGF2_9TELE|nr:hypothetical protein AAFF_G00377830 [Aldrovandia affinis]